MKAIFFIFFTSYLSGQWSSGTTINMEKGRKEIGLLSPFRLALKNNLELEINKFFLMPSVSIMEERPMFRNWEMARTFRVEYPTLGMKWLQSPLGMEVGEPNMFALISPQFNIPQMVSMHVKWIGTKLLGNKKSITLKAGLGISLGGKNLSNDATIDLPIIYPRLSVYYNDYVFNFGGEYFQSIKNNLAYLIDYNMIFMPVEMGRYAFENTGVIAWTKSKRIRIHFGYKLIAGEYPYGPQAHLFPLLDFQFGW